MFGIDKRVLNFVVIMLLTFLTFSWTFFIFKYSFDYQIILFVLALRFISSFLIFKDYSLSWSKASQKTFLIKSIVYIIAFLVYMPFVYTYYRLAFMLSELFLYILTINFLMYSYYYFTNKSKIKKDKLIVIYGAGEAGLKLKEEYKNSSFKVKYFIDDDKTLQKRTIDGIKILSQKEFRRVLKNDTCDLLVIALPSISKNRVKIIYTRLQKYFNEVKILPSLKDILQEKSFSAQLHNVSVEDLLARYPKDLDTEQIATFINNKIVLITGAGGSIGSEISKQCLKYGAKELILVDHSEINLYTIDQELNSKKVSTIMLSIVNLELLRKTFLKYKPEIVIHAAAYKHVPLCEDNINSAILNNVIGTKNVMDTAIEFEVQKVVMISTDKAVRPTNVMGTTKRICELYAQNLNSKSTEIVAVRFGNVLGSSGSVIPKFKEQIALGGPITVTHKDITRYFMLIPEACELVLQAASLGRGGEIFILDMGEPIKIVNLAKRMIELSGASDIKIKFVGLRPGEKLYEELLIDDSNAKTKYESITVAKTSFYDIKKLNEDIKELCTSLNQLEKLKEIVPEFNHMKN